MSGLEVLGIVASVISIADLGARLSVKLCTFSRKVKNADRSLAEISNDVALTCSVLRELGDNLKKDEQSHLYSNNAVTTAEGVIKECERVFTDLEGALEGERAETGTNHFSFKKLSGKLKYPFLEPQIELMRSNLERLKSTLLLMLNVIIYAGQLRSKADSSVLRDQQELIKILNEEKKANDKKFDVLTKAIEGLKPVQNGVNEPSKTSPLATQSPPAYEAPGNVCLNLASQLTDAGGATEPASEELAHYCALVKSLLAEIDAAQYKINQEMRQRFYSKVLGIHSKEVCRLKRIHGHYVVQKAFAHEPTLLHALSEIFPHDPLKQRRALALVEEKNKRPPASDGDDEEAVPVETGNKWLGRNANKGDRVGDTIISGAKTATYEETFGKTANRNPSNMQSGAYGRKSAQSYGAYQDRQLTAEEEEEEDILATKQQIRFMKQQDVSSTRNALRVAAEAEAEGTGRNTLARLGAQGERLHNTEKNLDLAADRNRVAEEKARELKTLNKSMFAVHIGNRFTAAERRRELDEDILNSHRDKERLRRAETLILPSTLPSRPPESSLLDIEKIQDSSVTISGSASIQSESSDASQMEMSPTDPKPETTAENVSQDPARGSELKQLAPQVSPLSFNSAPYSGTGVRTPTDIMRQRSEQLNDEKEGPEDIDEFHFGDPDKLRREKEKEDSRRRGALAPIPKNTTPSAATTEIDDLILQWTNIDKDSLNELNKEAGIGGEEDKVSEIET